MFSASLMMAANVAGGCFCLQEGGENPGVQPLDSPTPEIPETPTNPGLVPARVWPQPGSPWEQRQPNPNPLSHLLTGAAPSPSIPT